MTGHGGRAPAVGAVSPGNAEEWRPVRGFEELYEVSSLGRVRSRDRVNSRGWRLRGKVLRARPDTAPYGYLRVVLCRDGARHDRQVHHLVAEAFLDEPAEADQTEVTHLDGNLKNNTWTNLAWTTRPCGEHNGRSKLTEAQVREIRASTERSVALARRYGVAETTIYNARRGDTWYCLRDERAVGQDDVSTT